jgi:hypothetical protein
MDLKKLVRKPELLEVRIDDKEIIDSYGDSITFYMQNHLDIMTYFDFYRSQTQNDGQAFQKILQKIVLNKKGESILADDEVLPIDITLAVLAKVNEVLGKSKTRP